MSSENNLLLLVLLRVAPSGVVLLSIYLLRSLRPVVYHVVVCRGTVIDNVKEIAVMSRDMWHYARVGSSMPCMGVCVCMRACVLASNTPI